jgi:hypothetical protein
MLKMLKMLKMLDKNAIVRIVAGSKMGTGFLFGEKYILTCNHVVNNGSQITIQFTGIDDSKNESLQVEKVTGREEDFLDYAVLEIAEESLSLKPSKASCLCLANTEQMELREGLYVQLAGHIKTDDLGSSFSPTSEREVKLGPAINNGFLLWQESSNLYVMQDGFSGSPVLDIQTGKILGILNYTDADKYTDKTGGATGKMIRSDAIKRSLKEYDEQHETNYCDLLFTQEESLDTPYIEDNCTRSIQTLAKGLNTAILFIGSGINLYDRNNLEKEELKRISDFNNQSNRSLSEIELAHFLEKQIRKEDSTIKCLQAEIPELKDQAISPCSSCPYKLGERPEKENCSFRLENNSQDQTNNQLSIEEQLMNAQVNVQFLSQYYSDLCGDPSRVINEIRQFCAQSQPNEAHKLIAKYVKNKKIKLIITTNCDNLLERAFERAFESYPADIYGYGVYILPIEFNQGPLICIKEPEYPDAPIILKLHGCYAKQATKALITQTDFLNYYSISPYRNFNDSIKQINGIRGRNYGIVDIIRCNIWLIGYTLCDPEIKILMPFLLNIKNSYSSGSVYWMYQPNSISSKTNNLWKNSDKIKLVPRTLEVFFKELEYFLLAQKE